MLKMWNVLNRANLRKNTKSFLFVSYNFVVAAMVGVVVWMVLGKLLFPGVLWMLCFIGYPGIFAGFFGGIIYLYNNEFKECDNEQN